jgi:hypothetical protein
LHWSLMNDGQRLMMVVMMVIVDGAGQRCGK